MTTANAPSEMLTPRWSRSSLPPKTFGGFVLAVAALLVISVLSFRSLQARSEGAERVRQTLQLTQQLELVLSLLKDAETGQRGYLLTRDARYLQPYETAIDELPLALDQVRAGVEGNSVQRQRFDTLQATLNHKLGELEKTIAFTRSGEADRALAVVKQDTGRNTMDRLRSIVEEMKQAERAELEARDQQFSEAVNTSAFITLAGSGLLLALLLAALLMSSRDFREQSIQNWLRTTQAALGASMVGNQTLARLGDVVVRQVATALGAQLGVLYYAPLRGSPSCIGSFGLPQPVGGEPGTAEPVSAGGLTRQVLLEHKLTVVHEVPADYFAVSSGLGSRRPRHLVLVPTLVDGAANGVLELGFFQTPPSYALQLLERVAEPIAMAMRTSQYRKDLENLLEETQRQAEELQTRQEELRVSNEELEEQSRALQESQARLEMQQTELEQTNTQLEEQANLLSRQKEDLLEAQSSLTAKAEELERASKYKSEFLANMSHELRTPLNSSLILAKLLADNKEENLNQEQVKFAQSIYSAGNDLLELINDILDLSKIEAGKMEVHVEPVRLSRLVQSLEQTFKPLAEQKHVALSIAVEDTAPKSIVSDGQRLQQVLKNLLSNALKFTEKGEVSLRVFGEGERIAFAVKDTGIGIAAEQHAVIFEAFRQADGTTNRKFGGTGLGLSISRELAHLLGGEIRLQSAVGMGSTFTLVVPKTLVASDAGAELSPAMTPPPTRVSPRHEHSRGQRQQLVEDDRDEVQKGDRVLLVVEDDAAFALILRDLGRELGFRCLVAQRADEGFELALEHRPVAVVLDLNLPDHSGLTVLDRLKRNPTTRHIPVQVVSAHDYTRSALEMGAAGYMLKPVKREQLVEALTTLEAKYRQGVRSVLVVEDDERQRESTCALLAAQNVRTVAVSTASAALQQLKEATHDCMVLDLHLPDASGFELLERMAQQHDYSFPPVIVYTARSLSDAEEQRLRQYSRSIIIKGARSPERLLDEVTLFLHQVETSLPPERQKMLEKARHREELFENRRVLVVEDDVRNIFALSKVLEPKGAKVKIARNGKEALRALESDNADIVLMDIMMPEMDGYEAMRQIRQRPDWAKLPIIALTAKAMRDDQERCLEAGANDYIAKPIEIEKLLSLMRVWMPKARV